MKLYELKRHTKFRILEDTQIPPGAPPVDGDTVYTFDHIDGMYSLCIDEEERIVHISASAEVEPITP